MKTIEYKRSLPVKAAKTMLGIMHRICPQKMYRFFYNLGRRMLWAYYRVASKVRILIAQRITSNNQDQVQMLKLVDMLLPYTMGGPLALASTFQIVEKAERGEIEGALVECGVAKGGCSAMMALASRYFESNRKLWLFDSYEGLPDPTENDFVDGKAGEMVGPLAKGMLVGSMSQVERLMFDRCDLPRSDVFLVKGWFQDTLPTAKNSIGKIAVLRLDGDWYESTKCCLDNLFDNVTPGGFVIIDDYATCYGSEKAVTEFLKERGRTPELVPDGRGGAWFRKS